MLQLRLCWQQCRWVWTGVKTLIVGVTGQTGSLLARDLLKDGHEVIGVTRSTTVSENTWRLELLGVRDSVGLIEADLRDFDLAAAIIKSTRPDWIFFLGGQSSVAQSFSNPHDTYHSIATVVSHLLESIRQDNKDIRFFNASSTDCFGNHEGEILNEDSSMNPVSPYGAAKVAAHTMTRVYRDVFGLHTCNGILTNHESPLRGESFVIHKVFSALRDRALGESERIHLGNVDIERDWVWAPDMVRAIRLMVESDTGGDFVVGSGTSHSLKQLISVACSQVGIEPETFYRSEAALIRPSEIQSVRLDPSLIKTSLGWAPAVSFDELVSNLIRGPESLL